MRLWNILKRNEPGGFFVQRLILVLMVLRINPNMTTKRGTTNMGGAPKNGQPSFWF